MASNLVKEQLEQLPKSPGVYLMKDASGNILYVGKAANLRSRVRSYFTTKQQLTPKIKRLAARVADLDYLVTASEQEALILELNLIKRHRPHYNVSLKDDKAFPYLKVEAGSDWPRLLVTRRLEEDGGRYFGPFASAKSVRQTMKVIKEIFPLRSCKKTITGSATRPCLNYHIQHCLAPCIGAVSREEYAGLIKQVILFLEGKRTKVSRELERKMREAAAATDFEKAAILRDRIEAINQVIEGQRIATRVRGELDAIALAPDINQTYVQVFFVRGGQLVGREGFILDGTRSEEPAGITTNFLKQFYSSAPHIPPTILVEHPPEDKDTIEEWLTSRRGTRVRIQVPRRGSRKQLMATVAENARHGRQQQRLKQLAAPKVTAAALDEIARELKLPNPPARMEGYDISNIQGKMAVGSMVVFKDGKPQPSQYRRFRIKTVPAADDYAMIHEVLCRRFRRRNEAGGSWANQPDLVLIDGGKGQLSAAQSAMALTGATEIPIVGLAKEREEIFTPRQAEPIILPPRSPGLQLLQRLRDEAHRFAQGYHLKTRRKQAVTSALDAIPGIGPKRKRALLREFGSVKGIRAASEEELARTGGVTVSLAKKVKEYL